jgi:phage-related protein
MVQSGLLAIEGMVGPQKILPATFYQTAGGKEPVREWLKGLGREDCRAVGTDIADVEYGWPVGKPLCDSLGDGLWEVRSSISDGRIARVIFAIQSGQMALLHGFVKKTRKTPKKDRDLALNRKKELES